MSGEVIDPQSIIEYICDEAGIEYTAEHREREERLRDLAKLAELAQAVNEPAKGKQETFDHYSSNTPVTTTGNMLAAPGIVQNGANMGHGYFCFSCGQMSPHWSGGGLSGCMYCGHTLGNS